MSLNIEPSIDTRGYWIIDRSQENPCVLMRIWAMPDTDKKGTWSIFKRKTDNKTYSIYELPGPFGNSPLGTSSYKNIAEKVSESKIDEFMKSKFQKDLTQMISELDELK